jgi:hypothetical protein
MPRAGYSYVALVDTTFETGLSVPASSNASSLVGAVGGDGIGGLIRRGTGDR